MNAIITGATRGIGRAIALRFAKAGYHLALCARTEADLSLFKKKLHIEYPTIDVFTQAVDVSKKKEVLFFAKQIQTNFDTIDVLINNAGAFEFASIAQAKEGELEQLMATNLYSAYWLTQALLPTMIAQKSGDIFNICSVASLQAYDASLYTITKHALYGFSRALREELKPHNIRVCNMHPGATFTSAWKDPITEERLMPASDIAETVYNISQLSGRTVVEDIVLRPLLGDL